MAALTTVADYIAEARKLLQDQIEPYRYTDDDVVDALNNGMMEGRRIRPDLFLSMRDSNLPDYSASNPTLPVAIDFMYRMPFVYYMVGLMQLRDQEDTQDPRAMAFIQRFATTLTAAT